VDPEILGGGGWCGSGGQKICNPSKADNNGLLYTLNHKKRDILFLTITLVNLRRFL